MSAENQKEKGQELLSSVERILDSTSKIQHVVEQLKLEVPRLPKHSELSWQLAVSKKVISHYSTRSAISGGVTALPGLLPGVGTAIAALGGAVADMVLVLKFEVEQAMALTHLFGYDLNDPKERQLAFLLASVNTYEAKTGDNVLLDMGLTTTTALWNYTPRQISKSLASIMTKLALLVVSRGFLKALPVVGIVVGSSMNKVLTTKVGNLCVGQLQLRRNPV